MLDANWMSGYRTGTEWVCDSKLTQSKGVGSIIYSKGQSNTESKEWGQRHLHSDGDQGHLRKGRVVPRQSGVYVNTEEG